MSDRKLALCFAFLIPILFTLALPYTAGDLSVWIAHGEAFLKTGEILRHDIFSTVPTAELIYPSFGLSVLYAILYRGIGLLGVCLFHDILILAAILWVLYKPLIREGIMPGGKNLKWFLFLFWLGGVPTFVERPAMVALIPLILSFQLISKIKISITRADMLRLTVLSLIWANIHGSFILLPMMLAWRFFFLRKQLESKVRAAILMIMVFGASLANPFQWKIYPYLLETARLSKARGITEWEFPGLLIQVPTGALFWLVLLASLAFLVQAFRAKRLRETLANPFFLFLLMGTTSIRNAALVFVLILPAAHALGLLAPKDETEPASPVNPGTYYRNGIALACLILALPLTAVYKPKKWDETVAFALAERIRQDGRTCPVFNSWELGSFLMLEVPNKIFLDTRNIIYAPSEFLAYSQSIQGEPIWENYLGSENTCFVLVSTKTAGGLIERLKTNSAWEYQAEEGEYVLYSKRKSL